MSNGTYGRPQPSSRSLLLHAAQCRMRTKNEHQRAQAETLSAANAQKELGCLPALRTPQSIASRNTNNSVRRAERLARRTQKRSQAVCQLCARRTARRGGDRGVGRVANAPLIDFSIMLKLPCTALWHAHVKRASACAGRNT